MYAPTGTHHLFDDELAPPRAAAAAAQRASTVAAIVAAWMIDWSVIASDHRGVMALTVKAELGKLTAVCRVQLPSRSRRPSCRPKQRLTLCLSGKLVGLLLSLQRCLQRL